MNDRLLITIGLFVLVIAIALLGVWQFGRGLEQRAEVAARNTRLDAERRRGPMTWLDQMLRRTRIGGYVHRRITNAGASIRVSTFLLLLLASTVVVVVLVWHYLAPLLGVAAIALVAWAFFQFLRHLEDRRKEEFIGQLPELARVLSNGFSAGLALRTAVDMAAEELDDPARTELRRTADALSLGQSTEEALEDLGERLPSRELAVLVSTLVISARSGGSMVTALQNISSTLESRKEVRREVKTVLSPATYTGYLITAMGVGELLLINLLAPDGVRTLTTSAIGIVLLVVSATFFFVGLFLINRMSRVDV